MTTRCYRSKIGRLSFAVRNELNERIRDGAQGAELLDWLNGLKETKKILREMKSDAVNAQNLTDWRSTGYKDWLDDQADADRFRRLAEVSHTLASAAGGSAAGVACNIATAKIMDALEGADEDKIADLTRALAALRSGENAAQKVALAEEKNALAKEQLELSRAKFERDTTRLFIKWAQSKDALALATDKRLGSDEKTERLGRLMFGDLWEGSADGR
ncbi:MAG: hypothetical protein IJI36_08860 [Kiritimatiellae bacterium]|nr:hypothetical protein [Kiritimatiellia bacterium]